MSLARAILCVHFVNVSPVRSFTALPFSCYLVSRVMNHLLFDDLQIPAQFSQSNEQTTNILATRMCNQKLLAQARVRDGVQQSALMNTRTGCHRTTMETSKLCHFS